VRCAGTGRSPGAPDVPFPQDGDAGTR
jgi:hypothetical protein